VSWYLKNVPEGDTKRFECIDLFAGAGGLSLGFIQAGFKVTKAVDTDPSAVETYRINLGDHVVAHDLSQDLELPNATVIIGGPPCQGFSSAGRRESGDERNSLVGHFAKFVRQVRPTAFVFENVEGFLTSDDGERVLDLLTPLIAEGYRVHLRKVNAANYGAPQHRKRVIAIGGLRWDPSFPSPTHSAYGAPGAILAGRHLPKTTNLLDSLKGLPPPVTLPPGFPDGHFFSPFDGPDLDRARALKPGHRMRDLPESLRHASYKRRAFRRVMDGTPSERRGGAPAGILRLRPDLPSKAITGAARSEFIHPLEDRNLTLRECARLQTFPDTFVFRGTPSKQSELIGNAVPPILARMIAENLASDLSQTKLERPHGALLSFVPTLSTGMSPALGRVTEKICATFYPGSRVEEQLKLWLLPNHSEL
jgi:DNA (cytosine-5)-methyltransferase 1